MIGCQTPAPQDTVHCHRILRRRDDRLSDNYASLAADRAEAACLSAANVPTRVSEDTSFPFKIGDPCLVQLDLEKKLLVVKKLGKEEALRLGWRERKRRTD